MCHKHLKEPHLNVLMTVLNVFMLVIGVLFVYLGIHTLYVIWHLTLVDIHYVFWLSCAMIVSGCVFFCLSALALNNVFHKNSVLTFCFATSILCTGLVIFSCGYFKLELYGDSYDDFYGSFNMTLANYTTDNHTAEFWDGMQQSFECCGLDNSSDWLTGFGAGDLPDSCCVVETVNCGFDHAANNVTMFEQGCAQQVYHHVNHLFLLMAHAALFILPLVCGIFATGISLAFSYKDSGYTQY